MPLKREWMIADEWMMKIYIKKCQDLVSRKCFILWNANASLHTIKSPGSAHGIMVIIIENGHSKPSSNPG